MIWRNVMKYPVLIMGVIMFLIFINQETTKVWWENKVMRRFIPSTCDAVKDRVDVKAPKEWKMECPGTQLLVITIDFSPTAKGLNEQRILMYKHLANTLSELAHHAHGETLEYLKNIKVILKHKSLHITSMTDGQAVSKFTILKEEKEILEHLKLTVKVGEKIP
jgi:hypothetical protein